MLIMLTNSRMSVIMHVMWLYTPGYYSWLYTPGCHHSYIPKLSVMVIYMIYARISVIMWLYTMYTPGCQSWLQNYANCQSWFKSRPVWTPEASMGRDVAKGKDFNTDRGARAGFLKQLLHVLETNLKWFCTCALGGRFLNFFVFLPH